MDIIHKNQNHSGLNMTDFVNANFKHTDNACCSSPFILHHQYVCFLRAGIWYV